MHDGNGEAHDDDGAEEGANHRAETLLQDDAEIDVEPKSSHSHAEQQIGELHEGGNKGIDGRHIRTDGAGKDEAAHEPGNRHGHTAAIVCTLLAGTARFEDADDDGDRCEQQDAGKLGDDGAVGTGRSCGAAGSYGMRNLVEAQAGHDAKLGVTEAEEGLQRDFDECEDGTENGDDGHGQYGLVGLGLDGARDAHDGRGAADAAATGREQSERVLNLEETGDKIVERDHDGDDENGGFEALEAGAHEDDEIELEAQQDDAGAQEFVGDERGALLSGKRHGAQELQAHAEDQGQHEMADEREARQLREGLTGE